MTAFNPPFERLFDEDFNGGFRFKGRVNTCRDILIFPTPKFVFHPVDAMYATAYLFFYIATMQFPAQIHVRLAYLFLCMFPHIVVTAVTLP
jgi:hypothetical protein